MQQAKSAREAEQERQWKQMQALRQQQQQQQQQLMQDQRVQGTSGGEGEMCIATVYLPNTVGIQKSEMSQIIYQVSAVTTILYCEYIAEIGAVGKH